MKTVVIYGASDDLVEVEGDINEEYNPQEGDGTDLLFDDGTIVHAEYDEGGIWRVWAKELGTHTKATREEAPKDDDDCYSDRLTVVGPFESICQDVPMECMRDWIADHTDEISDDAVREIFRRVMARTS